MRVKDIMTQCPYKINSNVDLEAALNTMKLYSIRHLPIIDDDYVIGVVSENEIGIANAVCASLNYCPTLADVCKTDPLIVSEDTYVGAVAKEMATKKIDVALVQNSAMEMTGIVTTTDLCKALHLVLGDGE